ncbi:MAG TPA: 4,5-DOPA dioxygenase extradiol [Spirochaetia bacterium]|nr:4,5-DOPA dioxygenase extradiol [Spirochaetia bacterium]
MTPKDLKRESEHLERTPRMPVLFVGHGSPMNAIEENAFSRGWREVAGTLPRPRAILCVSAHWETDGTLVTAMERPRTIHDFGGFPEELYAARYPAPGSPSLAAETRTAVRSVPVGVDERWGLDHGCWSVLMQMYPEADVPVVQLSLDTGKPGSYHFELARELAPLRDRGILIIGSGNLVHNLRRMEIRGGSGDDFNTPYGFDWALDANALFKKLIDEERYGELGNYRGLGSAVQLAVPTPDHYYPMLYAVGLKQKGETIRYFNDEPVAGSLTMTSMVIGEE